VELQGVGSTLDLPTITPPNSPTPRGAGIPTQESPDINLPTIISHDSTPSPTLMSKPIVAGVSGGSLQIPGTRTGGVGSVDSTLIPNTVGISRINATLMTNTTLGAEFPYSTYISVSLRTRQDTISYSSDIYSSETGVQKVRIQKTGLQKVGKLDRETRILKVGN